MVINQPLVINQSGSFVFASDVTFSPTSSNTAAVIINSSNVILDLNGHFLTYAPVSRQTNIDAIYTNTGFTNVTIQNGFIQNFPGVGIHIADSCTGLKIYNCNLTSCLATGIFFDGKLSGTGINLAQISNCIVTACTGYNGSPAYGMRAVAAKNLAAITNVFAFNDAGLTTSGYGIDIENCTACQFLNNSCSFNGGIGEVAGFRVFGSTNCGFIQNVSNGNTCRDLSGTGTSAGYLSNQSVGLLFDLCRSISNATLASTNSAFGFLIKNGSNNFMRDCIAEMTMGGGFAAGYGIISESRTVIGTCAGYETSTIITGTAAGIYLNQSSQCQIKTCEIYNNSGISTTYGIWDTSPTSTNFILKNDVINSGTNYSVTYGNGVVLPVQTGSLSTTGYPSGTFGITDNISLNQ
jgi:hypothetical protein